MGATPDAELVARCRSGDGAAWDELVERFSRYVFAIASQGYHLRGDEAEDVFQEVFARVWQRLDTLRSDDALRPWLAQLTRRCCIDHLRASGRDVLVDAHDDQTPERALDGLIEELDQALVVRDALARLQPECREILDRFFTRDESYRTIADALGLPAGTIASRISRCLAKLRLELEGRNEAAVPSGEQVPR